ncbi:MAG TPA: phosphotransferase, partial [Chloroflexota bacterium]|nr:phosphotransferase [Chloroflexota bacterium]
MKPISRAALDWLCRELAPGGSVVRVRPLHGGVSCSVYAVRFESAAGAAFTVVVRRYREDWPDEPGVCGREFKLLEMLTQARYPAPKPLLLDETGAVFGAPTLVMTLLPGRALLQPRKIAAYIEQLAGALALLHGLSADGLEFLPLQGKRAQGVLERGAAGYDPLLMRVWDAIRSMWPAIDHQRRLIHADYWPGNTIWYRERLVGVIDWELAALGSPARDVATCRCDLNN